MELWGDISMKSGSLADKTYFEKLERLTESFTLLEEINLDVCIEIKSSIY